MKEDVLEKYMKRMVAVSFVVLAIVVLYYVLYVRPLDCESGRHACEPFGFVFLG